MGRSAGSPNELAFSFFQWSCMRLINLIFCWSRKTQVRRRLSVRDGKRQHGSGDHRRSAVDHVALERGMINPKIISHVMDFLQ